METFVKLNSGLEIKLYGVRADKSLLNVVNMQDSPHVVFRFRLVKSDNVEDAEANAGPVPQYPAEKVLSAIIFKPDAAGSSDRKQAVRMRSRHNIFKYLPQSLREAALEVIRSEEYTSSVDRAVALLRSLELYPRFLQTVKPIKENQQYKLPLDHEFNCFFLGLQDEIFDDVIEYFQDKLAS